MDFIDQIRALSERVVKLKASISTEEATKTAFIMPFLQALGYDVFNPLEVVPEFVADIGVKKGEKVDYAILKETVPVILVECKHWNEDLTKHNEQLYRYFTATKAKFGVLTNGIRYLFYSDLSEQNKMDPEPFFAFDISSPNDEDVEELKKFHKSYFEIDKITSTASDLKHSSLIKGLLLENLKSPSEEFVRFFVSKVYDGRATERVLANFTELVKKSSLQVINDMINDRLKTAMTKQSEVEKKSEENLAEKTTAEDPSKIVTTQEELDGFYIVKSILRKVLPAQRIFYRDGQAYFSIIVDDNNRKPICRLYFNGSKKYVVIFDESKKETRHDLANLDDLYTLAEDIERIGAVHKNP